MKSHIEWENILLYLMDSKGSMPGTLTVFEKNFHFFGDRLRKYNLNHYLV